jgi:hypothetical protein
MKTAVPDTKRSRAGAKMEPKKAAARSAPASAAIAAPAAAPAATSAATSTDASVLALQLLGRWQRVCNGHVAFANACACVFGAAVELSDFDDLILDYLCNKFAGQPEVAAYIKATAVPAPEAPGTLRTLLRKMAAAPGEAPDGQAIAVLRTLETSIASIEEQHAK